LPDLRNLPDLQNLPATALQPRHLCGRLLRCKRSLPAGRRQRTMWFRWGLLPDVQLSRQLLSKWHVRFLRPYHVSGRLL
jgi:hypothetical protein